MHHRLSIFYPESDSKTHFSEPTHSLRFAITDRMVDAALDMEMNHIESRELTFDQATYDAFDRSCLRRYDAKFGEHYIYAMGNHIIRGLCAVKHTDGRNIFLLFDWDDGQVMSFKFNHKHPRVGQNNETQKIQCENESNTPLSHPSQ